MLFIEPLLSCSQVSKQIQTLQQTELDNLKARLVEEHDTNILQLTEKHTLEIARLEKVISDVQEAHNQELKRLKSVKITEKSNVDETVTKAIEITPEVYEAMQADIDRLEEEKYNLRSMQQLMKDLMKDLAKHYDLSEKQVKFLSDSNFLDSFSLTRTRSQFNTPASTPFKYFPAKNEKYFSGKEVMRDTPERNTSLAPSLLMESLRKVHMDKIESTEEILNIIDTVKQSNNDLEQFQHQLETIASVNDDDLNANEVVDDNLTNDEFVGIEAGRLEVEKARLESELSGALQRIQV